MPALSRGIRYNPQVGPIATAVWYDWYLQDHYVALYLPRALIDQI